MLCQETLIQFNYTNMWEPFRWVAVDIIYRYFTGLYRTNYTGFSLLLDSFGRNSGTHQMERTEIM